MKNTLLVSFAMTIYILVGYSVFAALTGEIYA